MDNGREALASLPCPFIARVILECECIYVVLRDGEPALSDNHSASDDDVVVAINTKI